MQKQDPKKLRRKLHVLKLAAFLSSSLLAPTALSSPAPNPSHRAAIQSRWSHGTCELQGGVLTYENQTTGERSALMLVMQTPSPLELVCSDRFSVIRGQRDLVVAVGAEEAIGGCPILGRIGKEFSYSNSYTLDISVPDSDVIVNIDVTGTKLAIDTSAGNTWTINLSNPSDGWFIY